METLVRFTCMEVESKASFVCGKKILLTFPVHSIVLFINDFSGKIEEDVDKVLPEIFMH